MNILPPFTFNTRYLSLPMPLGMFAYLPETVEANGVTLAKKSSFHVSLVRVPDVARSLRKPEEWVVARFAEYAAKAPPAFAGFTGELRFAERGERKSVVALCTVPGLPEFFGALSEETGEDVAEQPTHVTLYTLQRDSGIDLTTPEAMDECAVIELPEVASALA